MILSLRITPIFLIVKIIVIFKTINFPSRSTTKIYLTENFDKSTDTSIKWFYAMSQKGDISFYAGAVIKVFRCKHIEI